MRTRRSPKNQDRLFRELFAPKPTPRPVKAELAICGNCIHFPVNRRHDGTCGHRGVLVAATTRKDCFQSRAEELRRRVAVVLEAERLEDQSDKA